MTLDKELSFIKKIKEKALKKGEQRGDVVLLAYFPKSNKNIYIHIHTYVCWAPECVLYAGWLFDLHLTTLNVTARIYWTMTSLNNLVNVIFFIFWENCLMNY